MKTVSELKAQSPVFLHDFTDKDSVIREFNDKFSDEPLKTGDYEDINILFASYSYENYSGDAWVLFEKNEELFEVNGSHCSCYGLEEQWEPEKVELKELYNRVINGSFGEDHYSGNEFKKEIKLFLDIPDNE